jgi:hypothetical protein
MSAIESPSGSLKEIRRSPKAVSERRCDTAFAKSLSLHHASEPDGTRNASSMGSPVPIVPGATRSQTKAPTNVPGRPLPSPKYRNRAPGSS